MENVYNTNYSETKDIFGTPPAGDLVDINIYQGYSNTCAIRCQEIIMRDFGIHISQEQLMNEARTCGWYDPMGGTPIDDVGKLLVAHGIPATRYDNGNVYQLVNELAQGKRIIVGVDADELADSSIMQDIKDSIFGEQPNHALIVAGIDTSDINNVQVVLTDPGTGHVAKTYPLDQFLDAWGDSGNMMVVTDAPAPVTAPGMLNFDYDAGRVEFNDDDFMDWMMDRVTHTPSLPTMDELQMEFGDIESITLDIDDNLYSSVFCDCLCHDE